MYNLIFNCPSYKLDLYVKMLFFIYSLPEGFEMLSNCGLQSFCRFEGGTLIGISLLVQVTGWVRLIRSRLSARVSFELSGNFNYEKISHSN